MYTVKVTESLTSTHDRRIQEIEYVQESIQEVSFHLWVLVSKHLLATGLFTNTGGATLIPAYLYESQC